MKEYCLGFMFQHHPIRGSGVWLIKKNRPDWQMGLWNGIGGRINPWESAMEAMIRETKEEAGINLSGQDWGYVARIKYPGSIVHLFFVLLQGTAWDDTPSTQTDEEIKWHNLDKITWGLPMVEDAKWMLAIARYLAPNAQLHIERFVPANDPHAPDENPAP